MQLHATRQPILDRSKELIGYELQFRDSIGSTFESLSKEQSSGDETIAHQLDFSLMDLTGGKPAFINFTTKCLQLKYPSLISSGRVAVGVLKSAKPGKQLLAEVKKLKAAGHTVVIENPEALAVWKHFYPYIDIIKIDFINHSFEAIQKIISTAKKFPKIRFLAHKIESYDSFDVALDLGFSYFQGYFFAKPQQRQLNTKSVSPSQIALISNTRKLKKKTLMARQPIFNTKMQTVAYELLHRSDANDNNAVFNFCGSLATIDVLLNSYTSVYQDKLLKRMPAFINLTYDLIVDNTLPDLPNNQIVLEILEDVKVTDELIKSVQALRKKGYTIALDDFLYDDQYIPLLKLAQIIKVDVMDMSFQQVTEQVEKLRTYKVALLAEKIETHEMYNHCKALGFKLFQGYFLSKPKIIENTKIEPSKLKLLSIIQALQNPNISNEELEKLILKDPVFTFKLLRIVNSSANGLVREISSVKETINILGVGEVKKWALIIVMISNEEKPEELATQLLIRGKMCEKVALSNGISDVSGYMIAGMISGLNAMLDIEMSDLLEQVPLSSEIKTAINEGQGDMGKILYNTINFTCGNWKKLSTGIDSEVYDSAYRESINWASESMGAVGQA